MSHVSVRAAGVAESTDFCYFDTTQDDYFRSRIYLNQQIFAQWVDQSRPCERFLCVCLSFDFFIFADLYFLVCICTVRVQHKCKSFLVMWSHKCWLFVECIVLCFDWYSIRPSDWHLVTNVDMLGSCSCSFSRWSRRSIQDTSANQYITTIYSELLVIFPNN